MSIARPQGDETLVAAHHGPARAGDTLVVASEDRCVFFRGGAALRVLEPGSYAVPAEFAGDDVRAYFIRQVPVPGQRFGGMLGVAPNGEMPKAWGEYTLRVTDPVRLTTQLVGHADPGTADDEAIRWVQTRVMNTAKRVIMKRLIRGEDPAGPECAAAILDGSREELASFGLAVEAITNLAVR